MKREWMIRKAGVDHEGNHWIPSGIVYDNQLDAINGATYESLRWGKKREVVTREVTEWEVLP